jgi:hypothetical protein
MGEMRNACKISVVKDEKKESFWESQTLMRGRCGHWGNMV